MIVRYKDNGEPMTEEQKREVEEASKRPVTYDEDSPELTPKMVEAFRKAARERDRKKKQGQ